MRERPPPRPKFLHYCQRAYFYTLSTTDGGGGGGGGVTPSPSHNTSTGLMSFLGTPVIGPGSLPRGYPSLGSGGGGVPQSQAEDTPVLGGTDGVPPCQDWGTPPPPARSGQGTPQPGLGYTPCQGTLQSGQNSVPPPPSQVRTGVPPLARSGWDIPPSPGHVTLEQVMPRAVRLLRFPAGGLSCFHAVFGKNWSNNRLAAPAPPPPPPYRRTRCCRQNRLTVPLSPFEIRMKFHLISQYRVALAPPPPPGWRNPGSATASQL